MIAKLKKVDNFERCFPHMMAELKKGNVWSWNDMGYTGELSDENKVHIKKLKDNYQVEVYAVLENYSVIGGDNVHMTSYLFVSEEDGDIMDYDENTFYAIADVVNNSWGIHEMGSVLIQRCAAGGPRRVG